MGALSGAAAGLGILGTGIGTMGQVQAADARAKAASTEAASTLATAAYNERQERRRLSLVQGQANATVAGANLSTGSGSPLFMELDRAKQAEIQALAIRRQGTIQAQGLQYEARLQRRQIPSLIGMGAGQGGSILTSFLSRS